MSRVVLTLCRAEVSIEIRMRLYSFCVRFCIVFVCLVYSFILLSFDQMQKYLLARQEQVTVFQRVSYSDVDGAGRWSREMERRDVSPSVPVLYQEVQVLTG